MNYICVKFLKSNIEEKNEILAATLSYAGFEGFEETENDILAYIPQKDYKPNQLLSVLNSIAHQLENTMSVELIIDRNWNELWESNYPPVFVDRRCYIYAPFHKKMPEAEYQILIKPKMSFGTAHHETTSQILQLMLDDDFHGKRVLDMGCGTGVLSILASMKGAQNIDAIDNDEWAFRNTLENIALNNITNINAITGDVAVLKTNKIYDIIFANINKNILLRDMSTYVVVLKQDGNIYFSGFYETDFNEIRKKAQSLGLEYQRHLTKNKWIASVFNLNLV